MALVRCLCVVLVLISANIAGGDGAARKRRQTPGTDPQQVPFLRELQKWTAAQSEDAAGNVKGLLAQMGGPLLAPKGVGMAEQNVARLLDSVQATGKNRVEFQLTEGDPGDPGSPAISVVVETLSAEDLLHSQKGREQLSQLTAQLHNVELSLSQNVQVMQGPGPLMETSQHAHSLMGGLVHALSGGGDPAGHTLMSMVGAETTQALNQLTQAMNQLPALRGLLENFSAFVNRLQSSSPATAGEIQRLLAGVFQTLQGMEQDASWAEADSMLELAFQGLNANLELLESTVHGLQGPTGQLAVNASLCLGSGLRNDVSAAGAAGCLRQVMHGLAALNETERAVSAMLASVTQLLHHPDTLHAVADLINAPSIDQAFHTIHTMMDALDMVGSDVHSALKAVESALQSLWNSQPLLETLTNIIQNPESSQVYEHAMQFLRDVGLDTPGTQQLLQVVNDTVTMMGQKEGAQKVADTIQEILAVLKNDPQPLSESQRALLEVLQGLLHAAQSVIGGSETSTASPGETTAPSETSTPTTEAPTTEARPTTGYPVPSSTTIRATSRPTSPATKNTSVSVGQTTSPAPSATPPTTRGPDTRDDNGSPLAASSAALTAIACVLAAVMTWR